MADTATYDPRGDFHFLGDDPTDEEIAAEQTERAKHERDLAKAVAMLRTFDTDGWRHVESWLDEEIEAGERAILAGTYENDARGSAHTRGQIEAARRLLALPATAKANFEEAQQRIAELTERPD